MANRTAQQGMTLLESLLALMALVTLMTLCATVLQQRCEQAKAVATARQLKAVSRALRTYVEDHFSELDQKNGVLSIEHLVNQGYYSHYLWKQRNAYQQEHSPEIIQMGEDQFWLLVVTQGGKAIPRRAWRYIGPLLAGPGGYYDSQSKKIIGCHQEWDAKVTNKLKPGHLILAYPLQTPLVNPTDTLLYRKKNPNHPQRQQVNTNLDLQQHAIVFETAQQQGKMSGQRLQFEQTTDTGTHYATLGFIQSGAEPVPQITLQTSQQDRLQISPTAVHITKPSLLVTSHRKKHQFKFNPSKNPGVVTLTITHGENPTHYGLQFHREWNQIPYHHLPYYRIQTAEERQKDIHESAHRICLLDQQIHQFKKPSTVKELHPHIGRLFIVGNYYQQQSTLFICGKPRDGLPLLAYPIGFHPQLSSKKTVDPFPSVEKIETKRVIGLKRCNPNITGHLIDLEMYFYIYDMVEKILFYLNLEEAIFNAEHSNDSTYVNLKKLNEKMKFYRKKGVSLKTIKENHRLKKFIEEFISKIEIFKFYKNNTNIPELFVNYWLHRDVSDTSIGFQKHKNFLEGLLTQLKRCEKKQQKNIDPKFEKYYEKDLDPKEVKKLLGGYNITTFLNQLDNFENISPKRWMQTVYVLSTSIPIEPSKDSLYELKLIDLPD